MKFTPGDSPVVSGGSINRTVL